MTNKLVEVKIENLDGALYVSSRDVAEGLGKQHKHVLEAIDKILESDGQNLDREIIASTYTNSRGKEYREYLLTKDGFTLYMFNVQGYNEFKIAYINKFNEMEKALQEVKPELSEKDQLLLKLFSNDPSEVAVAHKQLLELETKPLKDKIEFQNAELEEQKPKVEVYDNFIDKSHTLGFRELRKEIESASGLRVKENKLREILRELKIINPSNIKATAYAIRKGLAVTKDVDTNVGTKTQDRFTMLTRDLVLEYVLDNYDDEDVL